jgi:hypothetical protein
MYHDRKAWRCAFFVGKKIWMQQRISTYGLSVLWVAHLLAGCLVVKRPDNPQTGTPGTHANRGHTATNPKKTNDEADS